MTSKEILEAAVMDRIFSTAPIDEAPKKWALVPVLNCWAPMLEQNYMHDSEWGDCWRVYNTRGRIRYIQPRPDSYEGQKHAKRMRRLMRNNKGIA